MIKDINIKDLELGYRKITTMRKLLAVEGVDCTAEDLQKMVDFHSKINLIWLLNLIYYIRNMPKPIKTYLDKFDWEKDFPKQIQKFKQKLQDNDIFNRYDHFIFFDIGIEATKNISREAWYENADDIRTQMVSIRQTMQILIYNITQDFYNQNISFQHEDIIYNLPLLYRWIQENLSKPIETLTDDECELIACYMSGSGDELEIAQSYIKAKESPILDSVFETIAQKFHVKNILQVIFRILLLKPYLLANISFPDIAKEIKETKYDEANSKVLV